MNRILEIVKDSPVTRRWLGFLLFFGVIANLSVSWGQEESVLERGPYPDSVQGLNSPLDVTFLPLAPIPSTFTTLRDSVRDSLRAQLETLPPFFRDTQLGLHLRTYYLDRENRVVPPRSDNEAFTIGGSLAYQSGWLADTFRMGLEGLRFAKTLRPDSIGTVHCCCGRDRTVIRGSRTGLW